MTSVISEDFRNAVSAFKHVCDGGLVTQARARAAKIICGVEDGEAPKITAYAKNGDSKVAILIKLDRESVPVHEPTLEYGCYKLQHQIMDGVNASLPGCDVTGLKMTNSGLRTIEGEKTFVTKRFDCGDNGSVDRHVVPMRAVIAAGFTSGIKSLGDERRSYLGIANAVKELTGETHEADLKVFASMMANVAINNTDDHLGNHALLYDLGMNECEMSPVYDFVTSLDRIGAHSINIGPEGSESYANTIRSAAIQMGVEPWEAVAIAEACLEGTKNWQEVMLKAGLSEQEVELIRPALECGKNRLEQYVNTVPEHERTRPTQYTIANQKNAPSR